jgi:hypothetical protein
MIGNYIPPWQAWIVSDLDIVQEFNERLANHLSPSITASDLKIGDVYACNTDDGWFRGCVDKIDPLEVFLVDIGCYGSNIIQIKDLTKFDKKVPPLAAPYQIFDGAVSSKVDSKLKELLLPSTYAEALLDPDRSECALWVNGQNVLEAAGHMVRVEVSHW